MNIRPGPIGGLSGAVPRVEWIQVPRERRKRIFLLLALAAIGCTAAPAGASAAPIQLGAYTPGAPADAEALSDYAAMVGRQPDIVMWYRDFGLPLLYSNEIANLRTTGQTPMVTWEPYRQRLAAIASGAYDSYLRDSAEVARGWGRPLMIRFAHEMNAGWYPWGRGSNSAATYVAAWRHVVSVFRAQGADNVKWVFSPNVEEGGKYPIAPRFPGDSYVDYVALDGYNWGSASGNSWASLADVFSSSYRTITRISSRPVMIAETSSAEAGGSKASWIRAGLLHAVPQLFPRISAVIWFNRSQEDEWQINSSPAALGAYRDVVDSSLYGGSASAEAGRARSPAKQLRLRSVRVTPRVRLAGGGPARGRLAYRLSATASVRITVERRTPAGHFADRGAIRCQGRGGSNRIHLSRLLGRRALPGGYRVIVRASDGHGRRAAPRRARFRVT